MTDDLNIQKTFRISLEDDNLIVIELLGNVPTINDNVKQAEMISQTFHNIFSNIEEPTFKVLVILSGLGGSAHYPSPQARQIYVDLLNNEKMVKLAVVAPNPLLRAVMKFIVYDTMKGKDIKFFDNRDKATKWLMSQNNETEV